MTQTCRQPCPSCPWRVDQHAQNIPNFKLAWAEELVACCNGTRLTAPVFACHQSRPAQEVVCTGWLVRYGWDNISVRLMLAKGVIKRAQMDIGEGWPELHETFEQMIEKLRADCA